MAETNAENEPTMEEILASIRRIISEDEEGETTAAGDTAESEPEPEPEIEAVVAPEPEPEPVAEADDVLELTQPVPDEDDDGDLVIFEQVEEPEPEPVPTPAPAPKPAPVAATPVATPRPAPVVDDAPDFDSLVSNDVADAAANAFGDLLSNMMIAQRPGEGVTLEGLVRELLRPMLKDWLDANLDTIVRETVQAEVTKIAERARR